MGKRGKIALLLLAAFPGAAEAVEFRARFDIQGNGIYRTLEQQGFSEGLDAVDGILFVGSQVLATSDRFELEIRHELRSIFGDTPTYPRGDVARLEIRSPDRFLHLDRTLVHGAGAEIVSDVERLRASWILSSGELWVGRRPISIGTLNFFKVWNKFTRPVSGLFGPTIVYGSDGAGASFQAGDWSVRGFALLGATHESDSTLAEATWNAPFGELRLLGGSWWRNTAVGAAVSMTVWDWMLRTEALSLSGQSDHAGDDSEVQIGIGLDGALDAEWTLLFEGYWQTIGETDTSRYTVFDPSRFTNLRARYYAFGLLSWQASALWKFGLGDLVNVVDGGQIAILRANHSLSDEIELVGEANIAMAPEGAEFSKRAFVFRDGNYLGTGNQFTLGLRATF